MNTDEALEAMTDPGRFELLATSVLGIADGNYKAIIHIGVNAKGKPIKSLLDGFCKVPGSDPALFLLVQHTTVEIKSLKRKWLHDHRTAKSSKRGPADDGDLIKAGHKVKELQKEFTDAEFRVVLTTNRRVDMDLQVEVHKKGQSLGVEVDIWSQSRLVRELDNTPEGQWLRRKFLDIEEEMLSLDLLSSICKKSLRAFEKEVSHITEPESWISREVDELVASGIQTSEYTIQFLVGDSGSGKSSVAYQVLKRHIDSGGYGIWAEARSIGGYTHLENALDKVLRDLHPRLEPDAGKVALQLVQREKKRLLLIVDDVNRTHEPSNLVRKILTWSRPPQSEPNSQPLPLPHLAICPIWPGIWSETQYSERSPSWISSIHVESMNPEEGTQVIQMAASRIGMEITTAEAGDLTARLGSDPILIGLFSRLLPDRTVDELSGLAENVFDEFMKKSVYEAVEDTKEPYLDVEYYKTLSEVCLHMLRTRSFYPSWDEIKEWLQREPDRLNHIRILIRHGVICRLGEKRELVFRHDRVRDALLAKTLSEMLTTGTPDADILGEPFYAEVIGRAFADNQCSRQLIREIRDRLPLALFTAIRCFGTPESDHQREIAREAVQWIEDTAAVGLFPNSILNAVCWALVGTDSPIVIEITDTLLRNSVSNRLIYLARLRSGCAASGVTYFNEYDFPTSDGLRDRIVEYARQRHKGMLLSGLNQIIAHSPADSTGALTLAGFLGFTDLRDEIANCWRDAENRDLVLPYAIWAATQCCRNEPSELLDPLMEYWATMSDKRDGPHLSPKLQVAGKLRFAMQKSAKDDVIAYFVNQSIIHRSLLHAIAHMLSNVDSPDAIELAIRSVTQGHQGHSLWYSSAYMQQWDVSTGWPQSRRLSGASMERLKTLWESVENDEQVRKNAFRLWLTGIESEQLEVLRRIPPESAFHRYALLKRAELGDTSVVESLILILRTDAYQFRVAYHIWCSELMTEAERYLRSFSGNIPTDFSEEGLLEHYALSELLMRIPTNDAETLLVKHWGHLGYSPQFIQTALYVGTPKCLELAASSVEQCPTDVPIFRYVNSTFGFMELGKHEYLTEQHLDNLLPYLDRFGQHELSELAQVCQRLGIPEWSKKHVSDLLGEEYKKHYHPSEDDLFERLDEYAAGIRSVRFVDLWLEEFDERHEPREQILETVDHWLASHSTLEGLEVAAACIQAVGTRKDLTILDKYRIDGPSHEVARIREEARFSLYRRTLS